MTRPAAYVERSGSRWEAWTVADTYPHARVITRGDTLRGVCETVLADGYRVVEIPLKRGRK
jgi:hypothetical protein